MRKRRLTEIRPRPERSNGLVSATRRSLELPVKGERNGAFLVYIRQGHVQREVDKTVSVIEAIADPTMNPNNVKKRKNILFENQNR